MQTHSILWSLFVLAYIAGYSAALRRYVAATVFALVAIALIVMAPPMYPEPCGATLLQQWQPDWMIAAKNERRMH